MNLRLIAAVAALLLCPHPLSAQRTIVYDTLSDMTPTAIQCGFCAGERYGVIFRELPPPQRGLDASEFPLVIRGLQVAVANARSAGGMCQPSTESGVVEVHLRVYAGTILPTGEIRSRPADTPWEGETLVYENPNTPLQRSASSTGTADGYEINFNRLVITDSSESPIRVEPPNVYLRVEITLGEGEPSMSDTCAAPNAPPNLMPLLDRDGTIAPERNFIYANGVGYVWNSTFSIMGDWAVRLEVDPMGTGPGPMDAGVPPDTDAGAPDADAMPPGPDATPPMADASLPAMSQDEGCSCATHRADDSSSRGWLSGLVLLLALGRRFRASKLESR